MYNLGEILSLKWIYRKPSVLQQLIYYRMNLCKLISHSTAPRILITNNKAFLYS